MNDHRTVDIVEFVRVYMETYKAGGSNYDVCEKLNITYPEMNSKRSQLRGMGRVLPLLSNRSKVKDRLKEVDEVLNEYKEQ